MIFRDRRDGGRHLAPRVAALVGDDAIVLGAVRGGVPVAVVVARTLGARLDLSIVSRICSPRAPELTLGALAEDGVAFFDELACRLMAVSPEEHADMLQQAEANQAAENPSFGPVRAPRCMAVPSSSSMTASPAGSRCARRPNPPAREAPRR